MDSGGHYEAFLRLLRDAVRADLRGHGQAALEDFVRAGDHFSLGSRHDLDRSRASKLEAILTSYLPRAEDISATTASAAAPSSSTASPLTVTAAALSASGTVPLQAHTAMIDEALRTFAADDPSQAAVSYRVGIIFLRSGGQLRHPLPSGVAPTSGGGASVSSPSVSGQAGARHSTSIPSSTLPHTFSGSDSGCGCDVATLKKRLDWYMKAIECLMRGLDADVDATRKATAQQFVVGVMSLAEATQRAISLADLAELMRDMPDVGTGPSSTGRAGGGAGGGSCVGGASGSVPTAAVASALGALSLSPSVSGVASAAGGQLPAYVPGSIHAHSHHRHPSPHGHAHLHHTHVHLPSGSPTATGSVPVPMASAPSLSPAAHSTAPTLPPTTAVSTASSGGSVPSYHAGYAPTMPMRPYATGGVATYPPPGTGMGMHVPVTAPMMPVPVGGPYVTPMSGYNPSMVPGPMLPSLPAYPLAHYPAHPQHFPGAVTASTGVPVVPSLPGAMHAPVGGSSLSPSAAGGGSLASTLPASLPLRPGSMRPSPSMYDPRGVELGTSPAAARAAGAGPHPSAPVGSSRTVGQGSLRRMASETGDPDDPV